MEINEFCAALEAAVLARDILRLAELEALALQIQNPHYFSSLVWWVYEMPPQGVEEFINPKLAAKYFELAYQGFMRQATEQQDPVAMYILSDMYAMGKGVNVDLAASRYWIERYCQLKEGVSLAEWSAKIADRP